jgi:hypothetical protein
MPTVELVPLPAGSLAAQVFPQINYFDSYRIQLPPDLPADLDELYLKVFTLPPHSAVGKLMRLRNALVKPLGLKTGLPKAHEVRKPMQIGDRARLFKLFQRAEDELLLGEDDKHLDFRVSVLRQHQNGQNWLTITTVVQYNNWFGGLYFSLIRPFHARLMPWMMKQAFAASTDHPTISTHAI